MKILKQFGNKGRASRKVPFIRQQWERGKIGTIRRRKDIGVLVDDNLPFAKFIQAQVDKTNRILGLIRRTYTR